MSCRQKTSTPDFLQIYVSTDFKNDIMSVLGLDSGYTFKCNPLPSGVPLIFALGNSFTERVIFDRTSLVSS